MRINRKKILNELERTDRTLSDLAREMGVSRQAVSRVLRARHKPNVRTIEKIAKALALDPKDLLI